MFVCLIACVIFMSPHGNVFVLSRANTYVCMHVCMYVLFYDMYTQVSMWIHVIVCACIHVGVYVGIYVCMDLCIMYHKHCLCWVVRMASIVCAYCVLLLYACLIAQRVCMFGCMCVCVILCICLCVRVCMVYIASIYVCCKHWRNIVEIVNCMYVNIYYMFNVCMCYVDVHVWLRKCTRVCMCVYMCIVYLYVWWYTCMCGCMQIWLSCFLVLLMVVRVFVCDLVCVCVCMIVFCLHGCIVFGRIHVAMCDHT